MSYNILNLVEVANKPEVILAYQVFLRDNCVGKLETFIRMNVPGLQHFEAKYVYWIRLVLSNPGTYFLYDEPVNGGGLTSTKNGFQSEFNDLGLGYKVGASGSKQLTTHFKRLEWS